MADPATDVPGFDDYSAALDRMRQATDAGQEPNPGDIDIFRRGNATHRDAYSAAQAQASPSPATSPQPQDQSLLQRAEGAFGQADPNSLTNILLRGATNVALMPSDFWASAVNAAKAAYEKFGGTNWGPQFQLRPDATPVERQWAASVNANPMVAPGGRVTMPSQAIRGGAGIPEMGPNASMAQQLSEAAIPIVAGSVPAAKAAMGAVTGAAPKTEALLASLGKNVVLAPAASLGGAALGEKIGGEPGAFIGGIAAPLAATAVLPQAASRLSAMAHTKAWQAPETPYGEQVQIPGAQEVTRAANELEVQPRFGMLATLGGKKMEGAIGSLGFTPASRAMEADRPMFEAQAAKLLETRRALPDPTPETSGLIAAAQNARNSQISQGMLPNQATSIPAVEQYMANKMGGNFLVDVTSTANALKDMYQTGQVPGGGSMQQITPQMRNAIADKYNQLTTPTSAPGEPGDGIAAFTHNGQTFAPWSLVRGWRQGLGMQTQKALGMQGPQLDHAYAAITNDMKAAAAQRGLSPAEFDAAMAIERNEMGADALKEKLLDPTLLNRKATYAGDFGTRMQKLYEDSDVFKKTMGGPYISQEAPMPAAAGDIRRQAYNLGVLGRSSYMPPEQTGQMQALWRGAKQLVLPGIGTAAGTFFGSPAVGAGIGAALNYLRSGLMESPTTRDMMMGRPVPWTQTPSIMPSVAAAIQQDNIRRALGGGPAPPPQQGNPPPANWTPYSPPQPGVVPKRPWTPYSALPTTQGILAAWNRANVGNPRSMTAA